MHVIFDPGTSVRIASRLPCTVGRDCLQNDEGTVADPEGVPWVLWNPSFEGLPSKILCANVYEHYTHTGATHFSFTVAIMHVCQLIPVSKIPHAHRMCNK